MLNEELESIGNAFLLNEVPGAWAAVGFLSLKPLAAWTMELKQRVQFLDKHFRSEAFRPSEEC